MERARATAASAGLGLIAAFGLAAAAPGGRTADGRGERVSAQTFTAGPATEAGNDGSAPRFRAGDATGDELSAAVAAERARVGASDGYPMVVPAEAGQVAGQRATARRELAAAMVRRDRIEALGLEPVRGVDGPPPDRLGTVELETPFGLIPDGAALDPVVAHTGWVAGQEQVLAGPAGRVFIRTWAHVTAQGAALAFDALPPTALGFDGPAETVRRGDRARFGAGWLPGSAVLLWTRGDLLLRVESRPDEAGRVLSRAVIDRVADAVDRGLAASAPADAGSPSLRATPADRRRAAALVARSALPAAAARAAGLGARVQPGIGQDGASPESPPGSADALGVSTDELLATRLAAAMHQRLVLAGDGQGARPVGLRILAFPTTRDAARALGVVLGRDGSDWQAGSRGGTVARRVAAGGGERLWRRGRLLLHLRIAGGTGRHGQRAALERRIAAAVDRHVATLAGTDAAATIDPS